MLNIAIVENEEAERENLKKCIDYLSKKESFSCNVFEFTSGSAFVAQYQPIYDIILMDIDMPGMNGMETAHAVRRVDASVILVFVTNLVQYAISGYEVGAMGYILKPINPFDFSMKMHRAVARTANRDDESIQIRTADETLRVRIASVRYLEVQGHYVSYCTTEGDYQEYITLKEAEKKLNKPFFAKCSRPFLVNLKYVTGITETDVIVGKDKLPISRSYKKDFLAAFSLFIGGIG